MKEPTVLNNIKEAKSLLDLIEKLSQNVPTVRVCEGMEEGGKWVGLIKSYFWNFKSK